MHSPADNLAALRDGGRYRHRSAAFQPFKPPRLDTGVWLELPGPGTLAEAYIVPMLAESVEIYRERDALLARRIGSDSEPQPLNQLDLAEQLVEQFAALPAREDAGRLSKDLRLFATEAEPSAGGDYLRKSIREALKQSPTWRPPVERERVERGPAKTAGQRKTEQRTRWEAEETASVEWWLASYLGGDLESIPAPTPGDRVAAPGLYEMATEDIADGEDFGEPIDPSDPESLFYRVPGPRRFYGIADRILGPRVQSHGIRYYVIPQPKETHMDAITEAVLERVTQQLTEETLDEFGPSIREQIRAQLMAGKTASALTLQREHLAATGTDGAVVSLDDARARRR